jgi:hypothetical protein
MAVSSTISARTLDGIETRNSRIIGNQSDGGMARLTSAIPARNDIAPSLTFVTLSEPSGNLQDTPSACIVLVRNKYYRYWPVLKWGRIALILFKGGRKLTEAYSPCTTCAT